MCLHFFWIYLKEGDNKILVNLHLSHFTKEFSWLLMSPSWVKNWLYVLPNSIFFPCCIPFFSYFLWTDSLWGNFVLWCAMKFFDSWTWIQVRTSGAVDIINKRTFYQMFSSALAFNTCYIIDVAFSMKLNKKYFRYFYTWWLCSWTWS